MFLILGLKHETAAADLLAVHHQGGLDYSFIGPDAQELVTLKENETSRSASNSLAPVAVTGAARLQVH